MICALEPVQFVGEVLSQRGRHFVEERSRLEETERLWFGTRNRQVPDSKNLEEITHLPPGGHENRFVYIHVWYRTVLLKDGLVLDRGP